MLNKKTFVTVIELILEQNALDKDVSAALERLCEGSFISLNSNNRQYTALHLLLREVMGDKDDFISWWIYEDVEKKVWLADGTGIDVSTPELLYEYFIKYI